MIDITTHMTECKLERDNTNTYILVVVEVTVTVL